MFTKGKCSRSGPGRIENIKIKTKLLHLRHEIFCKLYTLSKLLIYTFTFRYSLASRAFPNAKYYVAQFPMGSKFHFSQWKISSSKFIFIGKYLKFKEIEYFFHYFTILSLKCDQHYFI